MKMDGKTLRFLLAGGHLNMLDREAMGIWPHPPIKFHELVSFLTKIVEEDGFFPARWEEHIEGEVVSEQMVIQKEEGRYLSTADPERGKTGGCGRARGRGG